MRHLVLLVPLILLGCEDSWGLENPDELAQATEVDPGRYEGELGIRVRAFMGPIRIGEETCFAPITVAVDPTAPDLVTGEASCEFPTYGEGSVDVRGDLSTVPEVDGTLDAEPIHDDWEGWFLESDHLYGQTEGTAMYEGVELRYQAFFESWREGSVEDLDQPGGASR